MKREKKRPTVDEFFEFSVQVLGYPLVRACAKDGVSTWAYFSHTLVGVPELRYVEIVRDSEWIKLCRAVNKKWPGFIKSGQMYDDLQSWKLEKVK